MLHGWADRSDTYKSLMPELSDSYSIISIDLPGFGLTESPKEIWGLDEYAIFTAHFLDKISIKQLYAVIGHSNGGAMAIRGISTNVIAPEKLVLIASSGVRDTDEAKRFMLKIIAKTGKVMTFWLPSRHKKKLQKILYGTAGSDMLVAPHMQDTFKKTVRQDIQQDAAKLTIPTLLIYGAQDKATPVKSVGGKLHSLINGSQMQVINNADHFVHQTATSESARLIRDFLK